MANSFGRFFKAHCFGESHGKALGVVVDGCPSGVPFSTDTLEKALKRRRPGQAAWVSSRKEKDSFEILSGVYKDKTLGTPITVVVENKDARSKDYSDIEDGKHRVGHADDLWSLKYAHVDLRGGGRSSGRETLSRVIAGAFAKSFLDVECPSLNVSAFVEKVFTLSLSDSEIFAAQKMSPSEIDGFVGRFPSREKSSYLEELLLEAKSEGKSYGGVAQLCVRGLPAGLGEPVFGKIKSDLSMAMMSIGATIGVEFGGGFEACLKEGTEFHSASNEKVYGGIRGGITTGDPIQMRIAFKPTSSVMDVAKKGRHDPCILPRAIPVLEAMTYLCIADLCLAKRLNNL